jgi:26S proteasome regulatory subunit N10
VSTSIRAELLASLTQDMGKIIGALHQSKLGGQSDIANGINIAQVSAICYITI